MGRRSRKKSLWTSIPLWLIATTLVAWGLWQAELFRRSLAAEWGRRDMTAEPAIAVESETVTPQGAMGGEPWVKNAANIPADGPTLTGLDGLAILPPPEPDNNAVEDTHLESTPLFDPALSADELTAQGMRLLDGGNIVSGRFALNAALARTSAQDEEKAQRLRQTLSALNVPVFLGTEILPDDPAARLVELEYGDSYLKLGRTYGVPAAFLQSINPAVSPRNLKPATGIKIVQGPFHVRISKRAGRADLYAREIYLGSMPADFPEGNYLPRGDYQITAGAKLQLAGKTWIGFEGFEPATSDVTSGWIFASAGPRGNSAKDRATGIQLADSDLQQLYNVLAESRSHLRIEP